MSRPIRTVLALCIVVAVVFSINLLKEWAAARSARAAHAVAQGAAQQQMEASLHDVILQAAQDAAKEQARRIADQIAATQKAASQPLVIDRPAFQITLPAGSSLNPEPPDLPKGRMTSIDLPTDCSLVILAVDDKSKAPAHLDRMTESLQRKLDNPTTTTGRTFDAAHPVRDVAISGSLQGVPYVFEVAECDGPSKACLFIFSHTQSKTQMIAALMRPAIATLKVKE